MTHDQFQNFLQQYIDRELEPLEVMILEEHLATCQPCRRMLNRMKVIDWDLKHQIAVNPPPELKAYRKAAIKAHLESLMNAGVQESPVSSDYKEAFRLHKHILQHTFSFISYNPANRAVARSISKTVSTITRTAGSRIKKRTSLFSRFSPGQA